MAWAAPRRNGPVAHVGSGAEQSESAPCCLRRQPVIDIVVPCDYICLMKTAGVRDLKTHLSNYLRDVAGGDVVLVTDRGRVVAELRPPGAPERAASPADLRYRQLVERGLVRPAAAPGSIDWASLRRLRLRRGKSQDLLDAEREE